MAHTFDCDCSSREDVYRVAAKVQREVGDVDILVNNAGILNGKKLMNLKDVEIERTMRINTLAHFWVSLVHSVGFNSAQIALSCGQMVPHLQWLCLFLKTKRMWKSKWNKSHDDIFFCCWSPRDLKTRYCLDWALHAAISWQSFLWCWKFWGFCLRPQKNSLITMDASLPWKPKQQQRHTKHNDQYWAFKCSHYEVKDCKCLTSTWS